MIHLLFKKPLRISMCEYFPQGRFSLSWGDRRGLSRRCILVNLAANTAFAETVHLNDSGTNIVHCYGFQPQSRPDILAKRSPVAAKWVMWTSLQHSIMIQAVLDLTPNPHLQLLTVSP